MKPETTMWFPSAALILVVSLNGIRMEKSWDCPCHGSRFTQEGGLIENPAMRDLELEG